MRRIVLLFSLFAWIGWPADLPVKQVVLYKHGVGFFEREGVVNAGEEVRLEFDNGDMNDVLKSLTVTDLSGGHVRAVRYDSNETPEQRLAKFPFQIGENQRISAFLDHMKGERIEISLPESAKVGGTILGARTNWDGHDQISILADSGQLSNYDLEKVTSLRFEDPRFDEDLKEYLGTLGKSKSREKRLLYIDAEGKDAHRLRTTYIAPVAIWKSSYRLSLGGTGSQLEGWAIVDNTTGEDWSGVQLSVVSGRPISFISLLDTPRYGNRQVAELPEDRAAGPVVYGGSVSEPGESNQTGQDSGQAGGAFGGVAAAPPPPAMAAAPVNGRNFLQTVQLESSSVRGATGATLGELFEYNFAGPITIKKNQSAMLPFLQDKVAARKLLIYTSGKDGEHPVNAAEITNSTGKTLDGGPITVYDAGVYAGEALFETLKADDKRLIGYAIDYGTRVEDDSNNRERSVREIHVRDSTLEMRYSQRQTHTYTVHNVDATAKTLIVEQDAGGYTVLSPKPVERTAKAYRFELKLPANGVQKLDVEQEEVTSESTVLTSMTADQLVDIIGNKEVSETARGKLKEIAELKREIVDTRANESAAKTQLDSLNNDQGRLRANIDSLNRVKGQENQVSLYSTQLGNNEVQIAKLRDQSREMAAREAQLQSTLRDRIEALQF